jgi:hypothetical protein
MNTNCGACGLFIEDKEQDSNGFHLARLCDAFHCEECDNGTDTPCNSCLWEESVK